VSVEAISWALNLAPVPADRGGQPSSACKFVLVGLANHAGPDGTGAFPSVATLVRYTGLSERTVRTCLDLLEAAAIISPCDPGIVAARIKRADRRPQGWDLSLSLARDDLDEADAAVLDRRLPGRRARSPTARLANDGQSGEVQPLHPVPDDGEAVDNSSSEVHHLPPAPGPGCNERAGEVQLMQPRGVAVAPEPSKKPSLEPSAAHAHVREALPIDDRGLGGPVGEFFAAIATDWRFTAAQRARLAPVVETALNTGWTPTELAAFTGGSTDGVRNPYAVLAARLSSAELPARPVRPARPPLCGGCDERTRLLGFDGDAPRPCPRCRPARCR
jgi:Helix-turn-helix domain